MPFDEIRFPEYIAYGSTGGPKFFTTVGETRSGQEWRNANWSQARQVYQPLKEIQDAAAIAAVLDFFNARRGKWRGFRFKDWADYATTNLHTLMPGYSQVLPILTAITGTTYQLVKYYISGGIIYTRYIYKPVQNTVRIWVNNVEQVNPGWTYPWSCNHATGLITFTTTPGSYEVKAFFEFDVPVRFNTDYLPISFDEYNISSIQELELIETRDID